MLPWSFLLLFLLGNFGIGFFLFVSGISLSYEVIMYTNSLTACVYDASLYIGNDVENETNYPLSSVSLIMARIVRCSNFASKICTFSISSPRWPWLLLYASKVCAVGDIKTGRGRPTGGETGSGVFYLAYPALNDKFSLFGRHFPFFKRFRNCCPTRIGYHCLNVLETGVQINWPPLSNVFWKIAVPLNRTVAGILLETAIQLSRTQVCKING